MVIARDCRFADHGTAALAIYGGQATLEHCEILRSPLRLPTSLATVAAEAAAANVSASVNADDNASASASAISTSEAAAVLDQVRMEEDENEVVQAAAPTPDGTRSETITATGATAGSTSLAVPMDTSAGGSGGSLGGEVATSTTKIAPTTAAIAAPVTAAAAGGASTQLAAPSSLKAPVSAHQVKLKALQAKAEKDLAKLLNTLPVRKREEKGKLLSDCLSAIFKEF